MNHLWTVVIFLVLINYIETTDLLDEYVRHVEETNKYQQNNIKFTKNDRQNRHKRSLELLDLQENQRDNILREKRESSFNSTIMKAFGNRQTLKKLIQTTKNEKKQSNRLTKRPVRSINVTDLLNSQERDEEKKLVPQLSLETTTQRQRKRTHFRNRNRNKSSKRKHKQNLNSTKFDSPANKNHSDNINLNINKKSSSPSSNMDQEDTSKTIGKTSDTNKENAAKINTNSKDSKVCNTEDKKLEGTKSTSTNLEEISTTKSANLGILEQNRNDTNVRKKSKEPKNQNTNSGTSKKVEISKDSTEIPKNGTNIPIQRGKKNKLGDTSRPRGSKNKNRRKKNQRNRNRKVVSSKVSHSRKSQHDRRPKNPTIPRPKGTTLSSKIPRGSLNRTKEFSRPKVTSEKSPSSSDEFFLPEDSNGEIPYPKNLETPIVLPKHSRLKRSIPSNKPVTHIKHIPMRWTHHEVLDTQGDVVLRWQPRHQEIAFRLEARTVGFAAIGFSKDGKVDGADLVVGWIYENEMVALVDCHATSADKAVRDGLENYTLMRGTQNDTHTVLEFRRALDTCDSEDFVLGSDTIRVIWILGDSKPDDIKEMHLENTKRGFQSLYLIGPPTVPVPEIARTWDITIKNLVLQDSVPHLHYCKVFKSPTLQHKHHIVGWEAMVGARHAPHIRHIALRECRLAAGQTAADWDRFTKMEGAACYGEDMPKEWGNCRGLVVAWGRGSKGETLPEHIGIPFSESSPSYYMLEIILDNSNLARATDSTGLRVHYTGRLRQHDAGLMEAGLAATPLQVVPPRQREYRSVGYCSVDCTRQSFPKDGINIVSVMLHSHETGRKITLRHIRGGREMSPIVQDNQYDPDYQHPHALTQEAVVLPGDGLLTDCTYSTMFRQAPTLGGPRAGNEQCRALLLHYPRTPLGGCHSMPPIHFFFTTFGVREFYDKDMGDVKRMFIDSR